MAATPMPAFEAPGLETYLAADDFDPTTRAFVEHMAGDGGAVIDLGDAARRLCDQAVSETEPLFSDGVARVQDAWFVSPAVRQLASLPQLRRTLQAAYGRRPFPFQTLNFRRGSEQHLHSDTMHFNSAPERFMCGVWIALEDVRPDAGPLIYKAGSHRLPVLTMRDLGVGPRRPSFDDYERTYVPRYAELMERSCLETRRLVIRKGEAFVWAANLAHGGEAIQTPQSTRRSLVAHFYFDDCLYFTPMYSDVEAGRLALRLPPDIATGLWRWPRRAGRHVVLSPMVLARAAKQRLIGAQRF